MAEGDVCRLPFWPYRKMEVSLGRGSPESESSHFSRRITAARKSDVDMKKLNILSVVLGIAYPVINIGVVYGIVRFDNWFLLSPVYLLLLGVAAPLLVLTSFWLIVVNAGHGPKSLILPGVATVAVVVSGALHFFISFIANASV